MTETQTEKTFYTGTIGLWQPEKAIGTITPDCDLPMQKMRIDGKDKYIAMPAPSCNVRFNGDAIAHIDEKAIRRGLKVKFQLRNDIYPFVAERIEIREERR